MASYHVVQRQYAVRQQTDSTDRAELLHAGSVRRHASRLFGPINCEQRTGPGTSSNRRFTICLAVQDYALAELDDFWPEATEAVRLECIDEASRGQSYVALASCIMARLREQRGR
jgi:hypothetical protein